MIAVDIGCKPYGRRVEDDSLGVLRSTYRPSHIYGFDPSPQLTEGVEHRGGTTVVTKRSAAWTRDGQVGWVSKGSGSHVHEDAPRTVKCFDLAAFLLQHAPVGVLKIDAEGAEYTLIPHLLANQADLYVETLLVEWHGEPINTDGAWDVRLWHQ